MSRQPAAGEVLIIGMSRSGTTVIADILRGAENIHVEMEPHLIWKAGDFAHLDDEDHPRDERAYDWIYDRLTRESAGRVLIEKSPPNCLRPRTVYRVFPNARVLYVVRDAEACLYSNYRKSTGRQALSPRIALRKYLLPSTAVEAQDSSFGADRNAVGGKPLWKQLRTTDARGFLRYSEQLWQARRRGGALPFGPKLHGFQDIVRDCGLLGYHARCMTDAAQKALIFQQLYGKAMRVVELEELVANPEAVVGSILDFARCDLPAREREQVIKGLEGRQGRDSVSPGFSERLACAVPQQWSADMARHVAALREP